LNNLDLEDVLAYGNTGKGITTKKEVEMEESFMNPIGSRRVLAAFFGFSGVGVDGSFPGSQDSFSQGGIDFMEYACVVHSLSSDVGCLTAYLT